MNGRSIFIVEPPRPIPGIVIAGKPSPPPPIPAMKPSTDACWVLLGAFGDICAMLPFFRETSQQTGKPCNVIVAKTYAPIFDGVSYVNPMVYPGQYSNVNEAMAWARTQAGSLTYINPPPAETNPGFPERLTDSFIKEMWRFVGRPDDWDRLPLVFDKRDYERELKLCDSIITNPGRVVLVAPEGRSSPFPYSAELVALLAREFPDFQIVDLSKVAAEKPYDLLGLFDRSLMLMTVDTFHMHLSRASSVPVFGLHTQKPTPWNSSPAYLNQFATLNYEDFPKRQDWMIRLIRNRLRPINTLSKTVLVHVYNEYDREGESSRRHKFARASWEREYEFGNWKPYPVHVGQLERNSGELDDRRIPFLKDLIDFTVRHKHLKADAIVVFTNDDTCFTPGLTQMILREVGMKGAAFAKRRDFKQRLSRLLDAHEIRKAYFYTGQDLFAFTVEWWKQHKDEMPDMLIAFEAWDWILRELILLHGGGELFEAIYHEYHPAYWQEHRLELKGNIYNRNLARKWLTEHKLPLRELENCV